MNLPTPLHVVYLDTPDPYGRLTRELQQYLKLSHVTVVDQQEKATTIIAILKDENAQSLLSVSSTQQTRQYSLKSMVIFEVRTPDGSILLPAETLTESRTITIQSNQILGGNNEATQLLQQMKHQLAYNLMNRLASKDVLAMLSKTPLTHAKKSS